MDDIVKRLRNPTDEQWHGRCSADLMRTAADEIERQQAETAKLREALKKLRSAAGDAAVYADAPKTHEMDDGEAGVVCAWEALHNLRLAITDADAAVA